MTDTVLEAKVKGLLKAEMKRRNVTYAQLVKKAGGDWRHGL